MRRALVTGGSGAIGAAICRSLAVAGCHVYVHANRGGDRAEAVVADIAASGGSAQAIAFDVTDEAATAEALAPMIRRRWGRIVSVSSVAAFAGNRGQTNYAAAKAGLHGATRSLALELASRGITVNAVAPGIIASPMAEAAFSPERIASIVPMKRAGTPEEVAALVQFLASDAAGYISGQVISINGAMI